jgi:hypothetical protein
MSLYIQHGAKLIVNQIDCLYRHLGANSDGAACFLICTGLISQQVTLQPCLSTSPNTELVMFIRVFVSTSEYHSKYIGPI